MNHKEIYYECPKCKGTQDAIGLIVGSKKFRAIHICTTCHSPMTRHVKRK